MIHNLVLVSPDLSENIIAEVRPDVWIVIISPWYIQFVHGLFSLGIFSEEEVVAGLKINPRVEDSDQRLVHPQVKSLQDEKARLHHPQLHAQLGATVVVQLVLVEHHLVEEQDLLLDFQLVVVNLKICWLDLEMVTTGSYREDQL